MCCKWCKGELLSQQLTIKVYLRVGDQQTDRQTDWLVIWTRSQSRGADLDLTSRCNLHLVRGSKMKILHFFIPTFRRSGTSSPFPGIFKGRIFFSVKHYLLKINFSTFRLNYPNAKINCLDNKKFRIWHLARSLQMPSHSSLLYCSSSTTGNTTGGGLWGRLEGWGWRRLSMFIHIR